ncbi:hypothetical protein [Phreatobacter sp.]|uniref:hypothetical protein n=1 Tax=Phreatobacter sp. TaxID=1966341 RepID=UPI003F7210F0
MTGIGRLAQAAAFTLSMAILATASAPAEARRTQCRANGAHYVLQGAPQVTALFRGASTQSTPSSDLVFQIRTAPDREYLFLIHQAQGFGRMSLEPVSHPGRTEGYRYRSLPQPEGEPPLLLYTFDRRLRTLESPPREGVEAPRFVFVPDVAQRLWYDPASLTDRPGIDREVVPVGLFRRVHCGNRRR